MEYPEKITTIDKFNEFSIKEKNSLFIGQVYHCENEEDTSIILTNIKKKYYDATHHCYAYKFNDSLIKYSDDGEPNGTAGIRILNALEHFNLTNVIVVVIRYYGGTKLGVGPLGKAYYNVAFEVLDKSDKKLKHHYMKVLIEGNFNFSNLIHKSLSKLKAIIVKTEYTELATFECLVEASEIGVLKKSLINSSKGEIKFSIKNEHYYK